MKRLLMILALTMVTLVPSVKEINAYRDHGSEMLILMEEQEAPYEVMSLRHQ